MNNHKIKSYNCFNDKLKKKVILANTVNYSKNSFEFVLEGERNMELTVCSGHVMSLCKQWTRASYMLSKNIFPVFGEVLNLMQIFLQA